MYYRSNHPEVFLKKGVLKVSSKFRGEHPCRSVISALDDSSGIIAENQIENDTETRIC